jgi:methyl-accepting chemotaxis protein
VTTDAPTNSSPFKLLKGRKLLLQVTVLVCIITATAVSAIQLNNIIIGGTGYSTIKSSTAAIENIALIGSNLHQIINEVRPIMHDADKGAAITMARLLAIENDKRFANLQELVKRGGRREIVIKADATWKEYKKTLLEEIVPAAGKGDRLKIAYLTTGIQAQRYNSLTRNMTSLTSLLREDIAEIELQAASDKTIKLAAAALLTSIVLGLIVYFSSIIYRTFSRSQQPAIKHSSDASADVPDQTLQPNSNDRSAELHYAINSMTERFGKTIASVSAIGEELVNISANLANRQAPGNDQCSSQKQLAEGYRQLSSVAANLSYSSDKLASLSSSTASAADQTAADSQELSNNSGPIDIKTEQISSAASEICSNSTLLSHSLADLKQIADNSSSASQQFIATIRQVEQNSLDSSEITDALCQDAESARQAADEISNSLKTAGNSVKQTSESICSLAAKTVLLEGLSTAFTEVAAQAGLLSLNASIIASQNRDHDADFTDFTATLKDISDQASKTAQELSSTLLEIKQETGNASKAINRAENDVSACDQLSSNSVMTLNQVLCSIQQASFQIRETSAAAAAQISQSQEFTQSIDSISLLATQSAEMSEKLESDSRSISSFSADLTEAVAELRSLTFRLEKSSGSLVTHSKDISGLSASFTEYAEQLDKISSNILSAPEADQQEGDNQPDFSDLANQLNSQIAVLKKELSTYEIKTI